MFCFLLNRHYIDILTQFPSAKIKSVAEMNQIQDIWKRDDHAARLIWAFLFLASPSLYCNMTLKGNLAYRYN